MAATFILLSGLTTPTPLPAQRLPEPLVAAPPPASVTSVARSPLAPCIGREAAEKPECRGTVLAAAAGGAALGFGVSLLYGLAVCLPRSFRDGSGCSAAVPLVLTIGGAVGGGLLASRSPACTNRP